MTEIPEHLRKRDTEARERVGTAIPAHLLDRHAARKEALARSAGEFDPASNPLINDNECARCIDGFHTFISPCIARFIDPVPERSDMLAQASQWLEEAQAENARLRQALQDVGVPVGLIDAIAKGPS